jgi:hypothetical protein
MQFGTELAIGSNAGLPACVTEWCFGSRSISISHIWRHQENVMSLHSDWKEAKAKAIKVIPHDPTPHEGGLGALLDKFE